MNFSLAASNLAEHGSTTDTAHEYEDCWRALFDASPLPMWIQDAETLRVLAVNSAALLRHGGTRDAFLASPPSDLTGAALHAVTFTGRPARLVVLVAPASETNATGDRNARLEQRLEERTQLLHSAKKELEAFSYSVSHDLRAPLRGIDGLARALAEDHAAALGADGQRMLGLIRNETRRMTQLIDALLAFSRAGRQEIDASDINMTDLAESAFQQLAESQPGPMPAFVLQPLPPAFGDRTMVRQVFACLLDNAVKFSRGRPSPQIELTGFQDGARQVYCVRDNGVGFNPAFADRLFNVFQRLHTQREFEGTGVGLAIVRRIVQRHGGAVWAEGRVDDGARFYFSLPPAKTPL
jgi:signal transduction histidine kinase